MLPYPRLAGIDMRDISDRTIFRPGKKYFWPDQDNIEWHRKRVFKR
jgi:hypothetical protein